MRRIFVSALCGAILLLLPAALHAQPAATCATVVFVQPGDTLSTLAARHLGDGTAYARIVTATNAVAAVDDSFPTIANPNRVGAGWKLCIPGADAGSRTTASTETQRAAAAATPAAATESTTPGAAIADTLTIDGEQLTIAYLRSQRYPGSPVVVEENLEPGANYDRHLVSYRSEGLKIYALMTIPQGEKPATGWPVIVFNHGYIPPDVYRSTERYVAYVDGFARSGYIVFRPDYRGHGFSDGEARGAYGEPGYTIDVLNAVAAVKQHPDADPNRVGMWGHSMGGYITLRAMVATAGVKAGVIWAGVVASYPDLVERWNRRTTDIPNQARRWRTQLVEQYGTPDENPAFWASISANSYLDDLAGPVQIHHGTADATVPVEFSVKLFDQIKAAGGSAEIYTYLGDDHNIAQSFDQALRRSLEFFDAHVKGK